MFSPAAQFLNASSPAPADVRPARADKGASQADFRAFLASSGTRDEPVRQPPASDAAAAQAKPAGNAGGNSAGKDLPDDLQQEEASRAGAAQEPAAAELPYALASVSVAVVPAIGAEGAPGAQFDPADEAAETGSSEPRPVVPERFGGAFAGQGAVQAALQGAPSGPGNAPQQEATAQAASFPERVLAPAKPGGEAATATGERPAIVLHDGAAPVATSTQAALAERAAATGVTARPSASSEAPAVQAPMPKQAGRDKDANPFAGREPGAGEPAPSETASGTETPFDTPRSGDAPARSAATSSPILAAQDMRSAAAASLSPAPNAPGDAQRHDFAAIVDRLVEAREAVQPQTVKAAINHTAFGQVALNFDYSGSSLTVSMRSDDPAFAPAAQAAASQGAGAHDNGGSAQRQDASGQPSGGQQATGQASGQAQSQGSAPNGERQRGDGSEQTANTSAGKPGEEKRPGQHNGIYA